MRLFCEINSKVWYVFVSYSFSFNDGVGVLCMYRQVEMFLHCFLSTNVFVCYIEVEMYLLNFLQQFNSPIISKGLPRENDPAALDIVSSSSDISCWHCQANYGIGNLLYNHIIRSLFPLFLPGWNRP
jgi:hypothetical protein